MREVKYYVCDQGIGVEEADYEVVYQIIENDLRP